MSNNLSSNLNRSILPKIETKNKRLYPFYLNKRITILEEAYNILGIKKKRK
jgi:hypothetical protein